MFQIHTTTTSTTWTVLQEDLIWWCYFKILFGLFFFKVLFRSDFVELQKLLGFILILFAFPSKSKKIKSIQNFYVLSIRFFSESDVFILLRLEFFENVWIFWSHSVQFFFK